MTDSEHSDETSIESAEGLAPPPPPPAPGAAAPAAPPAPPAEARSIAELGRASQIAVAITSLISLGFAYVLWDRSNVLKDIRDGVNVTFDDVNAADDRVSLLAGLWLLGFLVTGIIFIVWFHRAYTNLANRGQTKHSTGWAIGAWFVPFLNFWRPAKMTQELLDNGEGEGSAPTNVLWGWWILFIVGGLLGRGFTSNDTVDTAITSDTMGAVSALMTAGAGALLVLLTAQIVTTQAARAAAPPTS